MVEKETEKLLMPSKERWRRMVFSHMRNFIYEKLKETDELNFLDLERFIFEKFGLGKIWIIQKLPLIKYIEINNEKIRYSDEFMKDIELRQKEKIKEKYGEGDV